MKNDGWDIKLNQSACIRVNSTSQKAEYILHEKQQQQRTFFLSSSHTLAAA